MFVARIRPATGVAAGAERIGWLDAARGLGIVLVVLGHCLRGLVTAGILPETTLVQAVDRAIYAFHMPMFFLLAGMVFERSALSRPFPEFAAGWARRLLWPLALWTWAFFAFRAASGSLANHAVGWDTFPWNPLPPQAHFWFLWALFLIGIAVHLLRPLWLAADRSPAVWWAAFAVAVLLSWRVPPMGGWGEWLVPACLFAPCLFAGLLLAGRMGPAPGRSGMLAAAAVFAVALGAELMMPAARGLALAVALVAPVALVQLLRGLCAAGWPMGWLMLLGRASMAIFLAHTIFSAGLRIALARAGVTDPGIHLLAGTAIGVLAPLALWHLARRGGADRWLGF